ncbi:cytochrome b [Alteriqipengyuania lutimaris]|uniref:Cytochrome b n=1 Tax=Alteriqipengyuania lutimaris TaxID=1538146 RepID=A0A395LL76_9SPHN|nr:cytochrome b [Alteriqipengyuania lutimaris]MBB3033159.1 cytochrome b561 [Alteriqipengyuania lutimaris]RDS77786.1 cytochrome b [Alteriqipengyuania lutimaris]
MITERRSRYSTGAMIFHWLIAILVIVNWRIAESAEHLEGAEKGAVFANHKALGMLILALTLGRLAWRLTHPLPRLPENYAKWERVLARATHVIFYVLLIGLPLGGWLASSLVDRPIDFFGLFTIPMLPVGTDSDLGGAIFDAHATGGTIMIYLIVLHTLGALKHTFIDRDLGIFRMLPFGGKARE